MSRIALENMSFYAHHGCFEEEQVIGTRFRLDVTYETDTARAQQSDDISDTVSYLDVYQTVKREMLKPSHLLEHVGDTHQSLQEARAELRALGRSPDSAPQPQPDKTGDLPDTAPAACVETAPSEFMDKPLHWFEDSNDAVSSVKNAGLRVIRLKPRILLPGPGSCRRVPEE